MKITLNVIVFAVDAAGKFIGHATDSSLVVFAITGDEIERQYLKKQEKQQVEMPAYEKKNVPQGPLIFDEYSENKIVIISSQMGSDHSFSMRCRFHEQRSSTDRPQDAQEV